MASRKLTVPGWTAPRCLKDLLLPNPKPKRGFLRQSLPRLRFGLRRRRRRRCPTSVKKVSRWPRCFGRSSADSPENLHSLGSSAFSSGAQVRFFVAVFVVANVGEVNKRGRQTRQQQQKEFSHEQRKTDRQHDKACPQPPCVSPKADQLFHWWFAN